MLKQSIILNMFFLMLFPSDEDDEMYERLSGDQWRVECLMHLLAELKDCDLPGDFFLDLLQVNRDARG